MSALLAGLLLAATVSGVELLAPPELALTEAAALRIELKSSDGLPHVVRLLGSCPGGARLDPGAAVQVPASGSTSVERLVFRAEAAWNSRQELRVVAVALQDGAEPIALGATSLWLDVRGDPARLPGLRAALALAGLGLLAAACLRELVARWPAG